MYHTRFTHLAKRLFSSLLVMSLFVAGFQTTFSARAQQWSASPNAIQPFATEPAGLYYYADGARISLTPSTEWVSVEFASGDSRQQAAALRESSPSLGSLDQARFIPKPEMTLLPVKPGTTAETVLAEINAMRAMPERFTEVNPVFHTPDADMLINEQFIATFADGMSMGEIEALNASYGVQVVEPILGQANTFVLELTPDSHMDSLTASNLYQESGIAIAAAPNFVRLLQDRAQSNVRPESVQPMSNANDYWYFEQWSLNNDGIYGQTADIDIDAPEAWDHVTGSSDVVIAIIDEGVDRAHEDLKAKMVPGYDATGGAYGAVGGSPSYDDAHGTNVAGIAAAVTNNGKGVAGVCPSCKIMPVRIAYSGNFGTGNWVTYDSWIANSITWAYQHGAWVLNNSWGGGSPSTVINTAISNAKTLGRGGKGAVVLFAAGNDNGAVSYPGSLSNVITVAAMNMCDQRKKPINDLCNGYEYFWGSNYGSQVDISAPGVWLDSTDISGAAGYSSDNYFDQMNGTSGATPIVSGVAGLILSANPALTAAQVQTILQNTADDINTAGWDAETGYGRVNANKAVMASLVKDTVGVFRPSNGQIYLRNANSSGFADISIVYGAVGDKPIAGDWDGDGDATIGVFRNGTFLLRNSNSKGFADLNFVFGQAGDIPLAGDWDGNGSVTIGVFRPSTAEFLLRNSLSAGPEDVKFRLGNPGDVGIAGDWDGDGVDTVGVFRPSNGIIYLKNTNVAGFADIAFNFGTAGDKPVAGDWDNNGTSTIGIFRGAKFYLRNSNTAGFADIIMSLGVATDAPIAGNWDALP